jgi:sterol desaturase/sphingolipid hydroxylase (fatty acid hydroxylase superfamily)
VYDSFYYWFHRLQHANSWLWQQHKLHHTDQALNVTTSYRINWREDFFKSFLVLTPTALVLGLAPAELGMVGSLAGTVSVIWGQFLHSNIRLSFGALSAVVTGPQYHRIHHSIESHHQIRISQRTFRSGMCCLAPIIGHLARNTQGQGLSANRLIRACAKY